MKSKKHVTSAELLPGVVMLEAMKKVLMLTDGETDITPPFTAGGYSIEYGSFDADRVSGVLKSVTCKLKRGTEKNHKSPYFQPDVSLVVPAIQMEDALAEFIIEHDLEEVGLNPDLYTSKDFTFKWMPLSMNAAEAAKEEEKILVTAIYPIKITNEKVEENPDPNEKDVIRSTNGQLVTT